MELELSTHLETISNSPSRWAFLRRLQRSLLQTSGGPHIREGGPISSLGIMEGIIASHKATVQQIAEFFLYLRKELRLSVPAILRAIELLLTMSSPKQTRISLWIESLVECIADLRIFFFQGKSNHQNRTHVVLKSLNLLPYEPQETLRLNI